MAVFEALKNINISQSFEDVFKVKDITSSDMRKAILSWYNIYYDFKNEKLDDSQRIPYVIIDGLCKSVFGEYEYSIDEGKPNGKQLKTTLNNLDKKRNKAFQQAGIGGEIFIKPIIKRDNFVFSIISRKNMIVLSKDAEGNITDLVTSNLTVKGIENSTVYYWLLERRTLDFDGYCTIEYKLCKSYDKDSIGSVVPLNSIPEYANLESTPFTLSQPLDSLGLIPVKMPMENCVDESQDGVSIYAAAVGEIKKLYKHEVRTQNEYDLTEPHIFADIDIQNRDDNNRFIDIPKCITPLEHGYSDKSDLAIWNPKPNQLELEQRDDQIKRAIENIIGLRRGFLSKSDVQEFTATEIISTTTKMAHLIDDLQSVWESAISEAVRICSLLAQIYNLPGWVSAEPPEPVIEWGDGILYDEEKEFNRLNLMTSQGKLKDEYLLGWYFNMPRDTPEDLKAIRDKYIPLDTDSEGDEV